jgi:hypothetical protein
VEIPPLLRDFQVEGESPAFGLFHGAAFSTALFYPQILLQSQKNCGRADGSGDRIRRKRIVGDDSKTILVYYLGGKTLDGGNRVEEKHF